MRRKTPPPLGTGLGLRSVHYGHILENRPPVPWFEIISENYMGTSGGSGGRPIQMLEQVRKDYPIVMHGVSMSIGSVDPIDKDYLKRLKSLMNRIEPLWVSDHFCWTGVAGENLHDLLPLPYTPETIKHVSERILQVQDFLGRQFVLENVSSYVNYNHSEMTEWECLAEIAKRADCKLLFDVNNVYVSSVNHKFDPMEYLRGIPADRVQEFHLAGYSDMGTHLIDTHDHAVTDPVWKLYEAAVRRFGPVPTLIEWDDLIPDFPVLYQEAAKANKIQKKVLSHADVKQTALV
jgi:uncharacterized protein (UPF0276 family)